MIIGWLCGIAGPILTLFGAVASLGSIPDLLRRRAWNRAPSTPVKGLTAGGPIVLRGRVALLPTGGVRTRLTGRDAVWRRLVAQESLGGRQIGRAFEEEEGCDFLLDDGSGECARVVLSEGGPTVLAEKSVACGPLPVWTELVEREAGFKGQPLSCEEHWLEPGEVVVVFGTAVRARSDDGAGELTVRVPVKIVAPGPRAARELWLRLGMLVVGLALTGVACAVTKSLELFQ